MTIARVIRNVLLTVAALAGALACASAAVWIGVTKPWYSHELLSAMQTGVRPGPLRDETSRIGYAFPEGMSRTDAADHLSANGFACVEGRRPQGNLLQLDCRRQVNGFPCSITYSILVVLGDAGTVVDRSATSYAGCL